MIHVVVEGLDGTGKSTLVKALHERMLADQSFCQWIYADKEPGLAVKAMAGIEFNRPGINVRDLVLNDTTLSPLERELLFYVDASQHRRFIENQGNAIILSDRGLWSHYAYLYATMKTKQMDYEAYRACYKIVELLCPRPDFVVYLKGSLDLMKARNNGKVKDIIENNKEDYFSYVLDTYDNLALALNPLTLDATNSTSHNVEAVVKSLKERFKDEELKSGSISLCGQ